MTFVTVFPSRSEADHRDENFGIGPTRSMRLVMRRRARRAEVRDRVQHRGVRHDLKAVLVRPK